MAKEFAVTLGGKERRLAYTAADAIALKRRFSRKVGELLREDVMGMEKDKDGNWKPTNAYDLEVQIAFLHRGVASKDRHLPTEEQVTGWVEEHIKAGKPLGELFEPVWKAVYLSGILGYTLDIEAELEKAAAEEAPAAPLEGNG